MTSITLKPIEAKPITAKLTIAYGVGKPVLLNSIPWSRDLTNAAWTVSGTSVAALDATGLDGVVNTATTLTDDNAAAYENVLELVAGLANDASTHVLRIFVKQDADETRFPELDFRLKGGTEQRLLVQINTKTGASATRAPSGTTAHEVNLVQTGAGPMWEVLISVVNNTSGNTSAQFQVGAAAAVTLGVFSATAVGSIIVGNVELHLNKSIADVRGTLWSITENGVQI